MKQCTRCSGTGEDPGGGECPRCGGTGEYPAGVDEDLHYKT